MKSYQEHLSSLLSPKPPHLCQRSSAIFPFFMDSHIQTKLIFLNYWKLKRDITHLDCHLTLRDLHGQTILSKSFKIDQVKAYELSLSELICSPYPVAGSIEVEFLSSENLVFPFPGVTILYQSSKGLSFVHAAQRIYNDQFDFNQTKRAQIIESGFNIYAQNKKFPFITLIGGAKPLKNQTLLLTAINDQQEAISKTIELSSNPYQTHLLKLDDWKELAAHLKDRVGCMKIQLLENGSFPRLIVGNYDGGPKTMSVTHTYYDLSHEKKESDYWNFSDPTWQPMTLMLPLIESHLHFSKVYFYPIYSPCEFWIDCEIYNGQGQLLKTFSKTQKIQPQASFQVLHLTSLLKDLEVKKETLAIRLIAYSANENPIAARLKIGFDVGFKKGGLPCNICTNFAPANPNVDQKPTAFRWAPLMPKKLNGTIWCINDSSKKEYQKEARVTCTYHRNRDSQTLTEHFTIPPRGHHLIYHNLLTEEFFKNSIGWCSFVSDNAHLSTYYFAESKDQVMGGDHGF